MKESSKKAFRYADEKKVFPLKDNPHYTMWGVEGRTGNWIVRYDKLKEQFSCNCKNVRLTDCAHIKAVKINQAREDD